MYTVTSLTGTHSYIRTDIVADIDEAISLRDEKAALLHTRHPGCNYFVNGNGDTFARREDQEGLIGFAVMEEH